MYDIRTVQSGNVTMRKSLLDSVDSNGEYVKFSKEQFWLESPSEKLRKELEEELKLSGSNLRSHAWYYGCIPWEVSESLVVKHGDFLIRDSLSSKGDHVLTSHWNNQTLHFLISRTLVQSSETYTRVRYTLEGEAFDSVPALVHFYVGNKTALTQQSGAQIHSPVNRTLPLRYLEAAFSLAGSKGCVVSSPSCQRGVQKSSVVSSPSCQRGVQKSGGNGVETVCPLSPSAPHHREAAWNCLEQGQPVSSTVEAPLPTPYNTPQSRSPCSSRTQSVASSPAASRRTSGAQPCHSSPNNTLNAQRSNRVPPPLNQDHLSTDTSSYTELYPGVPPPLNQDHLSTDTSSYTELYPGVPPALNQDHLSTDTSSYTELYPGVPPALNQDHLSTDTDTSSYTELYPGVPPALNQDHLSTDTRSYTELYPAPPPQSYVDRLCTSKVENGNVYFSPVVETVSAFGPGGYRSRLMPAENKPLEVAILRRVKELLVELDPKTAARHITKADCMVARILEVSPEVQRRMGARSGMELLTLPHGHQLRLDLLERFHTMSIMLAVDILGCTGNTEERAALLHKAIQIAAELKSNLGNMFGFAAIMKALELPQVSRLEKTWTALRQRHTEGAILYEKTLKPFLKSLNNGKESCPLSNTSFPHIVPLLSLLEKSVAVGDGAEPWETVEVGVDVVMCHLGAARTIAQMGGVYRCNIETKLRGFQERPEVLELFRTEFQMRLLWGSRGAAENQVQRYAKFDQVLTALSNKLEPQTPPR